jgi:hypothetical protein
MRVEDGIEQAGRVDRLQLTAAPSSIGDSAPPDDSYRGNESPRQTVEQRLKLNNAARDLIGKGADATLVTINPDGSPQVSLVWVAL